MERMARGGTTDEVDVGRWRADRARRPTGGGITAPVITVSREYGARGAAVGRLVAQRLGFAFWDRALLAEMAGRVHVGPAKLHTVDEHHSDDEEARTRYASGLTAVAAELAAQGSAVLIGRGLNFLIDPSRALRIRVVCPLELRVRGLAEREGIALATARATVDYADRDRRAFVHEIHGRHIEDVTAYDLWISTGDVTVDAAAAVIISAYRYRFGEDVMRAIGQARM